MTHDTYAVRLALSGHLRDPAGMPEQPEQHERTANEPDEHLTFAEAADRLGITVDAVRMRVHRGKLASIRIEERTFVLWPQPSRDEQPNEQRTERTGAANRSAVQDDVRLVTALEERIASLERQLAERTEEIRRRDHIIAGMIERLPALTTGSEIDPVRDAVVTANQAPGATKRGDVGEDAAPPAASPWSRLLRWLRGSEPSR